MIELSGEVSEQSKKGQTWLSLAEPNTAEKEALGPKKVQSSLATGQ